MRHDWGLGFLRHGGFQSSRGGQGGKGGHGRPRLGGAKNLKIQPSKKNAFRFLRLYVEKLARPDLRAEAPEAGQGGQAGQGGSGQRGQGPKNSQKP